MLENFLAKQNPATFEAKILWNRISSELCFSYDEEGHYILDSMFMITGQNEAMKYLLAVLNSSISRHWIKNNAATLGDGVYGAKIYIEKLPIPKITDFNRHIADRIIALVDEILDIKNKDANANILHLESEIDRLVYTLYKLDSKEIQIIEGGKK